MDDNLDDYPWLVIGPYDPRLGRPGEQVEAKRASPVSFKFTSYKSENARVKEAVAKNAIYQTDPIAQAASLHSFRSRDKSREIQPSMRFKTRNTISDECRRTCMSLPALAASPQGLSSSKSASFSRCNPGQKSKLYFKSAHTMIMKKIRFGSGGDEDAENPTAKYDRLVIEVGSNLAKGAAHDRSQTGSSRTKTVDDGEMILRELTKQGRVALADERVRGDPLIGVAEKVLVKCSVIQQKKNLHYGGIGRRANVMLNTKEFLNSQSQRPRKTVYG